MKVFRKTIAFALALSLGLFSGVGVVYAGYAESAWWDTGKINGINYTQCAAIETSYYANRYLATAGTWVRPTNKTAQNGYMGAIPYLCYPDGTVCRAGNWYYNGTPYSAGTWMSIGYFCSVSIGTSWISWGRTAHWNGYSYYEYNTWQSPAQTAY